MSGRCIYSISYAFVWLQGKRSLIRDRFPLCKQITSQCFARWLCMLYGREFCFLIAEEHMNAIDSSILRYMSQQRRLGVRPDMPVIWTYTMYQKHLNEVYCMCWNGPLICNFIQYLSIYFEWRCKINLTLLAKVFSNDYIVQLEYMLTCLIKVHPTWYYSDL